VLICGHAGLKRRAVTIFARDRAGREVTPAQKHFQPSGLCSTIDTGEAQLYRKLSFTLLLSKIACQDLKAAIKAVTIILTDT
jgi:hypothetical protein